MGWALIKGITLRPLLASRGPGLKLQQPFLQQLDARLETEQDFAERI